MWRPSTVEMTLCHFDGWSWLTRYFLVTNFANSVPLLFNSLVLFSFLPNNLPHTQHTDRFVRIQRVPHLPRPRAKVCASRWSAFERFYGQVHEHGAPGEEVTKAHVDPGVEAVEQEGQR